MKARGFSLTCWLTLLCFLFSLGSGATPVSVASVAAPSTEEESPDSKDEEAKSAPQRSARRLPRRAHDHDALPAVLHIPTPLSGIPPLPLCRSSLSVLTLPLRC